MKTIIILFLFTLFSCTQYTAVTPIQPEYDLILSNTILNVNLYENSRQVYIENIGNQLIIELDYNINENNIIIYDVIVPNEKLFLYNWPERSNYDVVIEINSIKLY